VLVHGLDVTHFQHDLDPSARPLVGSHPNRMVLVQVRAKAQCDADRALRKRSIAARAFRFLGESEHSPVEIERGLQVASEELESKGRITHADLLREDLVRPLDQANESCWVGEDGILAEQVGLEDPTGP